jgi:hypothetical protein
MDDRKPMSRFTLVILMSSLLLAATGCAKFNLGEDFTLWKTEPKPQTPESVVVVWTETVLHQPGKPPVRGFGGRVMFHGRDPGRQDHQSILVDGDLMVYAYDNERVDPDNPAPDKKYVFPAHNLALHQSESSLGPSYSFWLPWDEAGGPQRQVSLLARFEDKSGKIVMSSMTHVTLPGKIAGTNPNSGPARFSGHTSGPGPLPPSENLPVQGGAIGPSEPQRATSGYLGSGPPGYGPAAWPPNQQTPSPPAFGVQQAAYQAPVMAPGREIAPGKSASPMSTVTIDVAPGQARRLLAASNRNPGPQADAQSSRATPGPETDKTSTVGGTAAGATPAGEAGRLAAPATDSARGPSTVRSAPASRSTYDPVRRQPHRGEWPHRLPPTPRFGATRHDAASPADEEPSTH